MAMESTDWREANKQRAALAAAMAMQQQGSFQTQGNQAMPMAMPPQFSGHPAPPFPFVDGGWGMNYGQAPPGNYNQNYNQNQGGSGHGNHRGGHSGNYNRGGGYCL